MKGTPSNAEKPWILMVSRYPIDSANPMGSHARCQSMMTALREQYQIGLMVLEYKGHLPERNPCFDAMWGLPLYSSPLKRKVMGLARRLRYKCARTDEQRMRARLLSFPVERTFETVLDEIRPQVVLFFFLWSAHPCLSIAKQRGIPTAVDTIDVLNERTSSILRQGATPPFWISQEEEIRLLNRFDHVIAIQEREGEWFREHLQVPVSVVSHSPGAPSFCNPYTGGPPVLLFLASASTHNLDALEWFLGEVWSVVVRSRQRGIRLVVAGSVCREVSNEFLDVPDVEFRGIVPELKPLFQEIDVVLNIPRFGSGLKIKAIEAFRYGKPVVFTPTGAQGLEHLGEGLPVFSEEEMAEKLAVWLSQPQSIRSAEQMSRDLYAAHFSPQVVYEPLFSWIKQQGKGS